MTPLKRTSGQTVVLFRDKGFGGGDEGLPFKRCTKLSGRDSEAGKLKPETKEEGVIGSRQIMFQIHCIRRNLRART